jgi:hypothetical protein
MNAADEPGAEASHRLVRPYMVTGGRTRSRGAQLPLETLVTTTSRGEASAASAVFEQRGILYGCREPLSIAEISALLGIPVGVARVLVGDLVIDGLLEVSAGPDKDERLIRRLIDGVRSL